MLRLALFLFILTAIIPRPVHAWGDAGHRMVCKVAWDELMEHPMAEVKEILGIATEDEFAGACTFADAYLAEHPEHARLHEVFIPKTARDVDLARDCRQGCLVTEIERNLDILKSGAPRTERAQALKLLAHFVGDIHQPLRVGFAEDRGGAEITAIFLGHPTTMRVIWDTELVATDPSGLDALANTYHAYTPLDRLFVEWISALPFEWATESLWIMRTPSTGYVGNPGGLAFDEVYVKQNLAVAHDRIAKAGMRLGNLLNEALRQTFPLPIPK